MKVHTLSLTDRLVHHASHRITVDYADVAALGASATGTLPVIPTSGTFAAGTRFRFAGFRLVTTFDFSDTGITSLLVEAGDGTDPNRFIGQVEMAADGSYVTHSEGAATSTPYAYDAADALDIKFTAANGGSPLLSECTSGELELYILLDDRNKLKRPAGAIL